jgi:hypothetical protein
LAYGGLGDVVGEVRHALGFQAGRPKVFWKDNAVQFTNNPFGGESAITLGNATTWLHDPYDPADPFYHKDGKTGLEMTPGSDKGHTFPEHETQHTYQGEQLGPAYLPSNVLGGLNALFHGEPWHGPHNWNERGPQLTPPVPWAPASKP